MSRIERPSHGPRKFVSLSQVIGLLTFLIDLLLETLETLIEFSIGSQSSSQQKARPPQARRTCPLSDPVGLRLCTWQEERGTLTLVHSRSRKALQCTQTCVVCREDVGMKARLLHTVQGRSNRKNADHPRRDVGGALCLLTTSTSILSGPISTERVPSGPQRRLDVSLYYL